MSTPRAHARTAPEWAKDLVIYELNPRAFTSPNGSGGGSGSGTFASLEERLPYLADLGVNAIWLAGYSVATDHFYGIWSVYAADNPASIDPSLGNADDFRKLIDSAHAHGIKVFLDVIAHGVLNESQLVLEHPEWFEGSSWGMTDYDYTHPEFRRWWIELWTGYALNFGVDGYRVDVDMIDFTLWDEIVDSVRLAGQDLVVFGETDHYHFAQGDYGFPQADPWRELGVAEHSSLKQRLASVQVSCHDNGWLCIAGNHYTVRGSRARLAHGALLSPRVPVFFSGEEFNATPTPLPSLKQGLFGDGPGGGWLYGNQLDWGQLEQPANSAMRDDVRTMLRIRRENAHLINGDVSTVSFETVPYDGQSRFVPYVLALPGREAVITVVNESENDRTVRISIPLELLQMSGSDGVRVTNLNTGVSKTTKSRLLSIDVPADGQAGGGYRVLKITPAGPSRSGVDLEDGALTL